MNSKVEETKTVDEGQKDIDLNASYHEVDQMINSLLEDDIFDQEEEQQILKAKEHSKLNPDEGIDLNRLTKIEEMIGLEEGKEELKMSTKKGKSYPINILRN
mmetsp:Transcript_20074/g.19688  ORF Transcript_20074/g.19688 Transcript_20074/m.19688 type:complete len:102 (-) Transcript_20074:714-1019(-)